MAMNPALANRPGQHLRIAALLCTLLLSLLGAGARAELQLLDGIAAIVNDDVVMLSELRAETEMIYQQLLRTQNQAPPRDALAGQVLERLILDKLQLAIAQRAGAQISESELDQAVAQVAEGQGLSATECTDTKAREARLRSCSSSSFLRRRLQTVSAATGCVTRSATK